MYQLASPITEWGKGEAASAQRRRKTSPPGMISTQRRPQLNRRGRAYHPRGWLSYCRGATKGRKNIAQCRESTKNTVR